MDKKTFLFLVWISIMLPMTVLGQPDSVAKPVKFLALGDSYTIGESVDRAERWPMLLADSLRMHGENVSTPTIIAMTGWRTDDLKNAIVHTKLDYDYDLVGLLIGVNNQFQGKPLKQYGSEFEDLLKTAVLLAGGKKERVFVVSIPDYGFTPFGQANKTAISQAIDQFNNVNEIITQGLGIKYVNITDISRMGLQEPDLVAGDDLHPSGKMYARWVKKILAVLNKSH